MTAVRCTDGDFLTSGDEPSVSGSWTWGMWLHSASGNYGGGTHSNFWAWDNASTIAYVQVPSSANTTIIAGVFDGDINVTTTILTGSSTAWIFISGRHTTGTLNYTYSWRLEGASSFTSDTLTTNEELTTPSAIYIGTNGFGENLIDGSVRSFFIQATVMSDGDLLTASTSLSAPAGTNQAFLDLDSPTNAGDNTGTGLDYTVTGTLQTDATEPDPSIGGGGGGAVTIDHSSTLSFPALCRKPQNDNGRWTRGRGGLWVPKRSYSFPWGQAA